MANGWSEAKQVAEFICRPAALPVLRRQRRGADRVFLGIDPVADHGLSLESDHLLRGSGSVRTADGWRDFRFTCRLDPDTGKVRRFTPDWPRSASRLDPFKPEPRKSLH